MRELLVGRSGTGKTRAVLERLADLARVRTGAREGAFARFQVILPTYSRAEHLKRHLLRGDAAVPGIFDRGIGTFEQLAERETGIRLSRLAPAAARDLYLKAALDEVDAPVFRSVSRFPGFRRAALRLVKEVKSAEPEAGDDAVARTAERLAAVGEALPGERGRKLAGLARVLEVYQRILEKAGMLDHEDLLLALLARLREGAMNRIEYLAVDGFSDMTEVQERIVHALAAHAEHTVVTLQADPDGGGSSVFGATDGLRRRLEAAAGFTVRPLRVQHRARGDLERLERLVAGESVTPAPADGSVRVLAGADPDDEADRVARTCLRFTVENIARSEILVVLRRHGDETSDRILAALRRHGVPARRIGSSPALTSPLLRAAVLVLRLLSGVADRGELLAALRGGLARDVDQDQADRLAETARLRGLRTAAELHGEAVRSGLSTCVDWLDALAGARPPASPAPPDAVARTLLSGVGKLVDLHLDTASDAGAARGALDAAALRRLATVAREVASALRALGEDAVTPERLCAVVEEALLDANVGVRDLRVDVVNVVDAEEARQWQARAVIVAGLSEGSFPSGAREDLFVSDRDRADVGTRAKVRLPGRVDEAARRERALWYAAVTRATERLVLTTPAADERGDPVAPSPFLEQALTLFPEERRGLDGAGRSPGDVRPAEGETFHEDDLLRSALGALTERHARDQGASRRHAESGLLVMEHLLGDPGGEELRATVRRAVSWAQARPAALGADSAARAAMRAARPRSASSLGDFAQCAYRHFAGRGLGLSERDPAADDGLAPLLAGSIVHEALENAFRDGAADAAAARRAFDTAWQRSAGHLRPTLALARDRARMCAAVVSLVEREAAASLVPGYRQTQAELAFGRDAAHVAVAGTPGVEITGRIDRIDQDGAGRALVIDWKWQTFDKFSGLAARIDGGRDLQLPLYALAVERLLQKRVVAAGLVALRDAQFRSRWLRLDDAAPGKSSVRNGVPTGDLAWTGDAREEQLARVEQRVAELDHAIRAGGIDVAPADPARCGPGRCPFADLCRYDEGAL